MRIEGIVYHHTGDSSPDPQFLKVDAYHRGKGFPKSELGFYVGYHFFAGQEGTVKQARKVTEDGAHTVNCGCSKDDSGFPAGTANQRLIGICYAGNGFPTGAQLAAITALTIELQRTHGIGDGRLYNHGDLKATSCPGMDMVREVLNMKQIWRQLQHAEAIVAKVNPSRKGRLLRFIDRAKRILFPNSFPRSV